MTNRPPPTIVSWWMMWLGILAGLPFFYIFLSPVTARAPEGGFDQKLWYLGLTPFVLSTLLRWLLLPRMLTAGAAMPIFILGMAMAEVCCFLGLFLFPAAKDELFVASGLGILQHAPFFASRFYR